MLWTLHIQFYISHNPENDCLHSCLIKSCHSGRQKAELNTSSSSSVLNLAAQQEEYVRYTDIDIGIYCISIKTFQGTEMHHLLTAAVNASFEMWKVKLGKKNNKRKTFRQSSHFCHIVCSPVSSESIKSAKNYVCSTD